MNFLIEMFMEIFFELAGEAWLYLLSLWIPQKRISARAKKWLKFAMGVWCVLLMISVFLGVIALSGEIFNETIGLCLLIIPIIITVIQTTLGIISRKKR